MTVHHSFAQHLVTLIEDYLTRSSQQPRFAGAFQEVQRIVRLRRMREKLFDAGLFADPAWDIMLDLYLAQHQGRKISVSSLCIAACVPSTTAFRCIQTMENKGLLEREADPKDRRRIWIRLSPEAYDKLSILLQAHSPDLNPI